MSTTTPLDLFPISPSADENSTATPDPYAGLEPVCYTKECAMISGW